MQIDFSGTKENKLGQYIIPDSSLTTNLYKILSISWVAVVSSHPISIVLFLHKSVFNRVISSESQLVFSLFWYRQVSKFIENLIIHSNVCCGKVLSLERKIDNTCNCNSLVSHASITIQSGPQEPWGFGWAMVASLQRRVWNRPWRCEAILATRFRSSEWCSCQRRSWQA